VCGRYSSSRPAEELAETFGVRAGNAAGGLSADYNVAPTNEVYGVLERAGRDDSAPVRRLAVLRWGLVPSWAKDRSIANKTINARMETVADKPAYRKAFAARRCLLPADGYYEWYAVPDRRKQPFYVHPRGGGVLAMAGLYEIWRDRGRDDDDPDAWLWSTTVLTTAAADDLGRIHDRAPLLVPPQRWSDWLDPGRDGRSVADLLVPATEGLLDAYPVSPAVGNVRNNGRQLLDPISTDDEGLVGGSGSR
jgi:putative SOS response-associated peptidase YedK